MSQGRLARVWARAVITAAAIVAAAEAVLASGRKDLVGRVAELEQLVLRLRCENDLLRDRLHRIPARERARYTPWQRLRILWHKVRYGLSTRETARIFVLQPSTVSRWLRLADRGRGAFRRAAASVNRLPDLVRELARFLRHEQPHWGTRRIAQVLARLGVQVSRSSVQRLLRKPGKPRRPRPALLMTRPNGIRPRAADHVWVIDFTTVGVLLGLVHVQVGAVIDAFSRSALAIGVHWGEPTGAWTSRLLLRAIRRAGARPTWIITDRGTQFRSMIFNRTLKSRKVRRRYGRLRSAGSISPIERFWLTLKTEWRVPAFALWRPAGIVQESIERWAEWFNRWRPHQGLRGRTPDEVLRGRPVRKPRKIDAGRRWILRREDLDGDRTLPIYTLRRAA